MKQIITVLMVLSLILVGCNKTTIPYEPAKETITVVEQVNETKSSEVIENITQIVAKQDEKAHGLWVYGSLDEDEYDDYIELIKEFNEESSVDIKYLFVWAGEFTEPEEVDLNYKSERVEYLKKNLPELKVLSMIYAGKEYTNSLDNVDLEELAENIANEINDDRYSDGVHLDIEPSTEDTEKLATLVKAKTDKIVTSAITKVIDKDSLAQIDFSVLMNYAQCQDSLSEFEKVSRSRLERYYTSCLDVDAQCMNGIMITTTSCETSNVYDHTERSIEVYEEVMNDLGDENMIGLSFFRLNYKKEMPTDEVIGLALKK